MKFRLAAIALGLIAAQPAAAQIEMEQPVPLTPALLAQIDAMPLEQMCSTRGAFQYDFGSTDLPPKLLKIPGFDTVDLPAAAAPFAKGEFKGTDWSGRFFMANYDLILADKAAARQVIERLAARFRALGWIELKGSEEGELDGPIYDLPPGEGDVAFYSEKAAISGTERKGARASLTALGGLMSFECTDMALMQAQVGEALGTLPVDAPKPVLPVLERPAAQDPAICATPEGIAGIAPFFRGKSNATMRYISARLGYQERMVKWKTSRLEHSGKVSKERMFELLLGGLDEGSFTAGFETAFAIVDKFIEIEKHRKAGDDAATCRATVAIFQDFEKIEGSSSKQWEKMEAALDTEAKRVGVSFD